MVKLRFRSFNSFRTILQKSQLVLHSITKWYSSVIFYNYDHVFHGRAFKGWYIVDISWSMLVKGFKGDWPGVDPRVLAQLHVLYKLYVEQHIITSPSKPQVLVLDTFFYCFFFFWKRRKKFRKISLTNLSNLGKPLRFATVYMTLSAEIS